MFYAILLSTVVSMSPVKSEKKDVALWLARSCVGESDWDAHKTGECATIWHIYLKRATAAGAPLLKTAKKYSATIKPRKDHPRPWVLKLDRSGRCPKELSTSVEWSHKRRHWMATLALADAFLRGEIADPMPMVEHYGGAMDVHILDPKVWTKRKPPGFKNIYYERRRKKRD